MTIRIEDFIQKALSPWHVATTLLSESQAAGAVLLDETSSWQLQPETLYVMRRGATFIAFRTPRSPINAFRLLVTHSDSPALKLKPKPNVERDGMQLIQLEPYGAPILPSWIGRPLNVAGVVYKEGTEHLIELPWKLFIPHIALHLERTVNEVGHFVHKHNHLFALAGGALPPEKVVDLYATIDAPPQKIGIDGSLLAAPRCDNLATLVPLFNAFIAAKPAEKLLQLFIAWNHEEIGSETAEGASSSLLNDLLERILAASGTMQRSEYLEVKTRSTIISCDVAHGFHPNYSDKNDGEHSPKLGSGVVLKTNPNQRYCYDMRLAAEVIDRLESKEIPYTFFSLRNDLQAGSTVGPRLAAAVGVKTLDIGIPLLGMHAAQEVVSYKDIEALSKLASSLFE